MKTPRMVLLGALLCTLLGLPAFSCQKEGPGEKAGKKIDETLDSAKEAIKKMTDE